jgi:treble-clef zinc-finger protein
VAEPSAHLQADVAVDDAAEQPDRGGVIRCLTTRTGGGVVLMSARRTGAAGRGGNSVGQYLCSDLACSLYIRGRKQSVGGAIEENLSREEKIARTLANLDAFLAKITR